VGGVGASGATDGDAKIKRMRLQRRRSSQAKALALLGDEAMLATMGNKKAVQLLGNDMMPSSSESKSASKGGFKGFKKREAVGGRAWSDSPTGCGPSPGLGALGRSMLSMKNLYSGGRGMETTVQLAEEKVARAAAEDELTEALGRAVKAEKRVAKAGAVRAALLRILEEERADRAELEKKRAERERARSASSSVGAGEEGGAGNAALQTALEEATAEMNKLKKKVAKMEAMKQASVRILGVERDARVRAESRVQEYTHRRLSADRSPSSPRRSVQQEHVKASAASAASAGGGGGGGGGVADAERRRVAAEQAAEEERTARIRAEEDKLGLQDELVQERLARKMSERETVEALARKESAQQMAQRVVEETRAVTRASMVALEEATADATRLNVDGGGPSYDYESSSDNDSFDSGRESCEDGGGGDWTGTREREREREREFILLLFLSTFNVWRDI
jgi:hypothetical protein